jgi:hypothetical protein
VKTLQLNLLSGGIYIRHRLASEIDFIRQRLGCHYRSDNRQTQKAHDHSRNYNFNKGFTLIATAHAFTPL